MGNPKNLYSVNSLLNELERIQASIDEEGFFRKLMNTSRGGQHRKSRKMAELIKEFPIPNNKEEVLKFMNIAISHIDTYFITHKNRIEKEQSITDFKRQELLTYAWISKMKQIYKEVRKQYFGEPFYTQIKNIYDAKMKEIFKANVLSLLVAFIPLYIIVIIFLYFMYKLWHI